MKINAVGAFTIDHSLLLKKIIILEFNPFPGDKIIVNHFNLKNYYEDLTTGKKYLLKTIHI